MSALTLTGILTVGPAHADSFAYQGVVRNWATGQCIDSSTYWLLNPCSNYGHNDYQTVYFVRETSGFYRIQPIVGAGCIADGSGGLKGDNNCAGPADEWSLSGNQLQGQFQNRLTGLCLDDNGHLYSHACNAGGYQKWRWDGNL